jgi:iron complex transport system permease protein
MLALTWDYAINNGSFEQMTKPFLICILLLATTLAIGLAVGPQGLSFDLDLITSIRAPRVFTAALAGASVAAAGALSQSLFRNSLATPSIIGTEAGASFSLALATSLLAGASLGFKESLIFTSIGAGLATLAALAMLNFGQPGNGIVNRLPADGINRLLLGGFAMNAFLAAGTSLCLSLMLEQGTGLTLYHWLMGSFAARTWDHVVGVGSGYFICVLIAWRLAPTIDVMTLGDDAASTLGVSVMRQYRYALILISILVGSAISCGGALPFIGLVAPHMARIIARPHLRTILVLSSLLGATLTISADILARTLRAPIDMDVGIITTIIGAPYFLWLMMRKDKN